MMLEIAVPMLIIFLFGGLTLLSTHVIMAMASKVAFVSGLDSFFLGHCDVSMGWLPFLLVN
jgi:hypothetical protein